jgi:hypothetical protein
MFLNENSRESNQKTVLRVFFSWSRRTSQKTWSGLIPGLALMSMKKGEKK